MAFDKEERPQWIILNMATTLQKRLAQNIVKNAKRKKPLNKKELLVAAGYDEVTAAATPGRTIEQPGVQEELKRLGFHEDNAKLVVSKILNDESIDPNPRLKAAEMIFKVQGSFAPEKHVNVNIDVEIHERERELALKLLQSQRTP